MGSVALAVEPECQVAPRDRLRSSAVHVLTAYLAAAGCVLLAAAARWSLSPALHEHAPLVLFTLAAILAALYGGLGPGIAATLAGAVVADFFFIRPYHTGAPGFIEGSYLLAFVAEAGAAVSIVEALRRADRRARKLVRLAEDRGLQLRDRLREIGEAEAKIRELATLVESAQDAIYSVSMDGKIRSWNRGAEALFGYQAGEIVGQPVHRLLPAERLAEHEDWQAELAQGQTISTFETTRFTKDGKELHVSISLSGMRDAQDRLFGVSAIVRDITELWRARAALEESEQRFHMLADAAPLMIWMSDRHQQRTWVNKTFLSFTGREHEQEFGEGWMDRVHVQDRHRVAQVRRTAFDSRQPFELEYRLLRRDGEFRWVFDQGAPHFGLDGAFLGYLGVGMDVTERKQAEEALERKFAELRATQEVLREQNRELAAHRKAIETERSRYRELFDSAPVGYLLTSREGIIQQVNLTASALLNESPDFLTGFPLGRLLACEDRPAFFANIARLTRGEVGEIQNWEATLQPHSRAPFPCSLTVNRVQDEPSSLTGLRWILRDVTERKQVEEKILRLNAELEERVRERTAALESANRELEAFSYSVSHDLRAPLRSINGFSNVLLEDYGDKLDEHGLSYLRFTHESAQRMGQLIEDLLALSRANRVEMHREEIDLSQLAASVLDQLRQREPQRVVDVHIATTPKAHGDIGLLRIALENLLGNAWKFTGRQPCARIEFDAAERNGSTVYSVRDNGAGFDMNRAERLFGAFQRLHSHHEFPGSGIGLATVRRILTRHGGEIWAESKVDEGATFFFTLPGGG